MLAWLDNTKEKKSLLSRLYKPKILDKVKAFGRKEHLLWDLLKVVVF